MVSSDRFVERERYAAIVAKLLRPRDFAGFQRSSTGTEFGTSGCRTMRT